MHRRGAAVLAQTFALAGTLLVLLLSAASPALAVETQTPSYATPSYPAYWVGRYCTSRACSDSKPSPLAHVAGFGASVLGALWIAGRPSARN